MAQECKVCLTQHDEEIHGATNRVHRWFRAQVTKYLQDPSEDGMPMEVEILEEA